jgi:hypothetical protein
MAPICNVVQGKQRRQTGDMGECGGLAALCRTECHVEADEVFLGCTNMRFDIHDTALHVLAVTA